MRIMQVLHCMYSAVQCSAVQPPCVRGPWTATLRPAATDHPQAPSPPASFMPNCDMLLVIIVIAMIVIVVLIVVVIVVVIMFRSSLLNITVTVTFTIKITITITITITVSKSSSHLLGSYLSFLLCSAVPYSDSSLNMSRIEDTKALLSNPPPDRPADGCAI